jgi:hypothetical protein
MIHGLEARATKGFVVGLVIDEGRLGGILNS